MPPLPLILVFILCLILLLPLRAAATEAQPGDCVVLLHGLARSPSSMKGLERALSREGYRVVNIGYPSLHMPLERLASEHLPAALAKQLPSDAAPVHFVTHSFGGILLRQFLANHELPNLGRVVMLAPPNHGSEVADSFRKSSLVCFFAGPNFTRIGTAAGDAPQQLAPVHFQLGVIAGDRSLNPLFSALLPGPDDGKVAVASTRVAGMKDFVVVHSTHMGMKWRGETQRQVAHFLAHGGFEHPAATPRD